MMGREAEEAGQEAVEDRLVWNGHFSLNVPRVGEDLPGGGSNSLVDRRGAMAILSGHMKEALTCPQEVGCGIGSLPP